jgi:hypothetical protein
MSIDERASVRPPEPRCLLLRATSPRSGAQEPKGRGYAGTLGGSLHSSHIEPRHFLATVTPLSASGDLSGSYSDEGTVAHFNPDGRAAHTHGRTGGRRHHLHQATHDLLCPRLDATPQTGSHLRGQRRHAGDVWWRRHAGDGLVAACACAAAMEAASGTPWQTVSGGDGGSIRYPMAAISFTWCRCASSRCEDRRLTPSAQQADGPLSAKYGRIAKSN